MRPTFAHFVWFVAYRLKPVLLSISIQRTSFFLFELYVDRPNMQVKFMHNLLKLAPIYHLKWAKKFWYVFLFLEKKSARQIRPADPSDRITQMKNFNGYFIVRYKIMQIFLTLVSKYAKSANKRYYSFRLYTNFDKNLWSMTYCNK